MKEDPKSAQNIDVPMKWKRSLKVGKNRKNPIIGNPKNGRHTNITTIKKES